MTRKSWTIAIALVAVLCTAGLGILAANDPAIPKQRVSPKLLKESLEHPVVTATAAHTNCRNLQELRTLADDLEKAGLKGEAGRLNGVIKEITKRAEQEMVEKKALVARLTTEIDDLKAAIAQ